MPSAKLPWEQGLAEVGMDAFKHKLDYFSNNKTQNQLQLSFVDHFEFVDCYYLMRVPAMVYSNPGCLKFF